MQQAILRQDARTPRKSRERGRASPDRRTVTVLFCDLVDSTRLATELDPEVYRQVISRYFDGVRTPIARHGGTLEKFIGDAVMAVFGVPELHEDDALRAVRAAAERFRMRCATLDIEARIGVSTGEVHVLSDPGKTCTSRAQRRASPHSSRDVHLPAGCFSPTRRIASCATRCGPKPSATPGSSTRCSTDAPAYARRLDAPLVGRQEELERLRDAYANARERRHCRVVTVVGEAGIGKTRLGRELVASVREEARVLVGRCVSYGEGATYLPIAEIVRAGRGGTDAHWDPRAPRGRGRRGCRCPTRRGARSGSRSLPPHRARPSGPCAGCSRHWRAKVQCFSALDDIHWAEPTLLDLVEYLGEWAEGPILLLCLARGDLLEARPGWGGPTSTGFLVELDPLPELMLGTLVEQLAGEPVDELQQRIVEHAGGNPLFAEQMLALAREAPDLAFGEPPATVEALLASRLDRLDTHELAVLRRAAVLGRLFSRAELEDLSPGDDVDRQLASLTERGLVHFIRDRFRFHHVLVRDVAYRGIPKADRAEFTSSPVKESTAASGADEIVGYHFEQAYRYLAE